MMARPLLVIFDCDGVLVDSELLANQVFRRHLGALGIELSMPEMFEKFVGRSMGDCLRLIAEMLGREPPPDFLKQLDADTFAVFDRELKAVAGIGALLDELTRQGLPYCVASSGSHTKMRKTLGLTGLWDRLQGRIFSASEVARAKPHPDIYLHAAAKMGVVPERCVVIEDSPNGVKAGMAAGMQVLGYAALQPEAKLLEAGARVFHRMDEVPALLGLQ